MKWKSARTYKGAQFKRLVGVERETFDKMVSEIIKVKKPSKHKVPGKKRGAKPKLRAEDELLMLMMYYREYRTFFHTGGGAGGLDHFRPEFQINEGRKFLTTF